MKKFEFSKLILGAVTALFFAGAIFGAIEVEREHASADSLFAYIGAPTATAFGFYAWKARAENMIKPAKSRVKDGVTLEQAVNEVVTFYVYQRKKLYGF